MSFNKKIEIHLGKLFASGLESNNGYKINDRKYSFPKDEGGSESSAKLKIIGKDFYYTDKNTKYKPVHDGEDEFTLTAEKKEFYELSNFPFSGKVRVKPRVFAKVENVINQKRSIWDFLRLR